MTRSPFVTVANLIEYATSSSAIRRRGIIEQYQNPKLYTFNWHGASDAIFVGRVCGTPDIDTFIDSEKSRLRSSLVGDTKSDKQPKHIMEMVELLETSDLQKVAVGTAPSSAATLAQDFLLSNLTIRVRPNLILSRSKEGKKFREFGVVKCHQLSSSPLDEKNAKLYATALQMYAEQVLPNCDVQNTLCRVYDLFGDFVIEAPKYQKRIRDQLAEAALEICDRWSIVGQRLADKRTPSREAS